MFRKRLRALRGFLVARPLPWWLRVALPLPVPDPWAVPGSLGQVSNHVPGSGKLKFGIWGRSFPCGPRAGGLPTQDEGSVLRRVGSDFWGLVARAGVSPDLHPLSPSPLLRANHCFKRGFKRGLGGGRFAFPASGSDEKGCCSLRRMEISVPVCREKPHGRKWSVCRRGEVHTAGTLRFRDTLLGGTLGDESPPRRVLPNGSLLQTPESRALEEPGSHVLHVGPFPSPAHLRGPSANVADVRD